MTPRERWLETVLFGSPDRVPLDPGWGRASTREAWISQGMPEGVTDASRHAYEALGGTLAWPEFGAGFGVNERMIPQFEEKVIEQKENSRIVQDWKGNICEIANEFTIEHLRSPIDFVTRRWVKCPVESRDDWEAMKERYNPDTPERLPENAKELGASLQDREHIIQFRFSGPFWQMREWLGFESLCTTFYDDPDLIRDMVSFWTDYVARLMQNALQYLTPDGVHLAEDMAYKCFAMISPDMTREFLFPAYRAWGDILQAAGVPVYGMDSDGFIGELIPIWMDAGINSCDPIEVAAGNDILAFREKFGKKMAYQGGVDKRAMAKGGAVIEAEISRLTPLIQDGGYIPSCDHGVPSDVSWPDFMEYVRLLARATGWMQ